MIVSNRDDAEQLLSKALSRHIGYTSGAFDLGRIFTALQPFAGRTSAYRDELVTFLGDSSQAEGGDTTSASYRSEILSFATSMGLLETVSSRDANLTRYAATELGRSVLGAQAVGDTAFYEFYRAQIVLRADADFLFPILAYLESPQNDSLVSFFVSFQAQLRRNRLDWLLKSFPERILLERVAGQISWLKRRKGAGGTYDVDVPTANTARHHATPRNGWIEQLGMCDQDPRRLTTFGQDVVHSLAQRGTYFWLAPPLAALKALGLSQWPEGQSEDSLRFRGVGANASEAEIAALVVDLKGVMIAGFSAAKLVHASQASLQLPIEYINFRAYRDTRSYDWKEILDILFHTYRPELQRYSARKGKIGFYRVMKA